MSSSAIRAGSWFLSAVLLLSTFASAGSQQTGGSSPSGQAQAPQAGADDNSFPEDVSRKAAKDAAAQKKKDSETQPSGPQQGASPEPSTSDSNPFPEDTSRKAADAARRGNRAAAIPRRTQGRVSALLVITIDAPQVTGEPPSRRTCRCLMCRARILQKKT